MKVILAYHFPCLDGAHSSAIAFLLFRELKKRGYNLSDFINYIENISSFEEIEPIFSKLKTNSDSLKIGGSEQIEEIKKIDDDDEYMPFVFPDLIYFPVRLNPSGKLLLPIKEIGETILKESILIIMDYYAQNSENIIELCTIFKKLIILDHHLSFEFILKEMEQNNVSNYFS